MNTINIADAKTADLVDFYNKNIVRFPDGRTITKFADRKTAEKRVADLVEKIASHFPEDETPEGTIPAPGVEIAESQDDQDSGQADGAATEEQTKEAAPELDMDGSRLNVEPDDQPTDAERAAMEESEYQLQSQSADAQANAAEVGQPESTDESGEESDEDEEDNGASSARGASAFNVLQATLAALNDKAKSDAENGVKPAVKSSASKASNSDGVAASWVDADIRAARLTRDGVKVEQDGKEVGTFKSTREAFRNLRLPDNKHIRFRLKLKEAHREHGEGATFEHNDKKYHFTIVQIDV